MLQPQPPPRAPYTPAQVAELVVKESDQLCDAFVKLAKMSFVVWAFVKFKYTPENTLTPAYKQMLCDANCPDEINSVVSDNPPT